MYESCPGENLSTDQIVCEYVEWLGITTVEHVVWACQDAGKPAAEAIGTLLWKLKTGDFVSLPGGRIKSASDPYARVIIDALPKQIDLTEPPIYLSEDRSSELLSS